MIRNTPSILKAAITFGCVIAMAACGGDGGESLGEGLDGSAQLSGGVLESSPLDGLFPSPRSLVRQASTPDNYARRKYGYEYDFSLPSSRVGTVGLEIQLEGVYDPGFNTEFSTLAYGGFRFSGLDGYDQDFAMRLNLTGPPQDFDTLFLGLSNWSSDSWDWYSVPADSYVPVPGLPSYISQDGDLLAMLVLMASDTCLLEWLIVGDRLDIEVYLSTDLDFDPTQNIAPRLVTFDASGSEVLGGTIVGYDFDWQDDGDFDVVGDEDGLIQHTYNDPGAYTLRVRAHDDAGNSADRTLDFRLVDPDNDPPIADIQSDVTEGLAPQEVNLDASGSTDDKGIVLYEWDLDGDGEFETATGDNPLISTVVGMAGTTSISVRTTDEDFASDVASVGITLPNGFNHAVVAPLDNTFWTISAAVCGESPSEYLAIAYQDSSSGNLLVARSESVFGNSWLGPFHAAPESDDTGYSPAIVKGQFGQPIVVFTKVGGGGSKVLQAVFAADNDCDTWFAPTDIDTFTTAFFGSDAAVVDGTVNVVAFGGTFENGSNSVFLYRSVNESGTNWYPGTLVYDELTPAPVQAPSICARLEAAVEWPVICFGRGYYGETAAGLAVISAADHDGASWNDPVWYTDFYTNWSSMALVNSRPTVISTVISQYSDIKYARSTSADGTEWPPTMDMLAGGDSPEYGDIAVVDGKPSICYYDGNAQNLYYMTAADADGTTWNEPFVAASDGKCGRQCSLVVRGGVAPVIVYYNDTDKTVNCAYWL